jgi:hypothetical protein
VPGEVGPCPSSTFLTTSHQLTDVNIVISPYMYVSSPRLNSRSWEFYACVPAWGSGRCSQQVDTPATRRSIHVLAWQSQLTDRSRSVCNVHLANIVAMCVLSTLFKSNCYSTSVINNCLAGVYSEHGNNGLSWISPEALPSPP